MEKQKVNKREWVKTVLIVFLTVMLVLTFFSNTIMNRSLPEVATQSVVSGAIHAKIRGNGTVAANETYDVTLSQTRKIQSVLVRVGDQVQTGDVLLRLEPMESEELKQAEDALMEMELNYQKSLISASNSSASENHEVQRLQERYNEALAAYQLYSREDPSALILQLEKAELELQRLEQVKSDVSADLSRAQQNEEYIQAKEQLSRYQSEYDSSLAEYEKYVEQRTQNQELIYRVEQQENSISYDKTVLSDIYSKYNIFIEIVKNADADINLCASNLEYFKSISPAEHQYHANELQSAYNMIAPIVGLRDQLLSAAAQSELEQNIVFAKNTADNALFSLKQAEDAISIHENMIEGIQANLDSVTRQISEQNAVIATMTKASTAAEALKSAEQALEDKLFEVNLGDAGSLDMQHAKESIEIQKKLIEALSSEADGQEIKANVSGVISAIHTSAGGTAGAETPVVSITVADRGYTLQIPVTAEQARQVSIGDTAEVSNYWNGNITATLENIINDPKNPTTSKVLMFRLSGDSVEPGTNLTLSIGQRSANYDALIPNSAVRTDANGSFVLVVMAKSSPLGNRYVATRADVQVLASDDTTSAVSGLVNGDFVITTSSVPVEAGDQVRLVDNG